MDRNALKPNGPNGPSEDNAGNACFQVDVSDRNRVAALAERLPDSAVFVNLAARQYHLAVPRTERQAWFNAVRSMIVAVKYWGRSHCGTITNDMIRSSLCWFAAPQEVKARTGH